MIQKILEFPQLLIINLIISVKSFIEYFRVVWRYYGNAEFRKADLAVIKSYLLKSPFRISKQFLKEKDAKDIYQYGETYLTAFNAILNKVTIKTTDEYVELGCGRGRTCFWVHAFRRCKVVGTDFIPQFIVKANEVVIKLKLKNLNFYCEDFLENDWPKGTIYYIDATLSEGEEIVTLLSRFDSLKKGVKVIAINMSLTGDFPKERPQWKELDSFSANFPWGEADVGIFEKIS